MYEINCILYAIFIIQDLADIFHALKTNICFFSFILNLENHEIPKIKSTDILYAFRGILAENIN